MIIKINEDHINKDNNFLDNINYERDDIKIKNENNI